jgi:O-antigen/teichoic acid export membrane protein
MKPAPSHDFTQAAIKGTAWRYVAFAGGKFLIFLSTIILARLLSKEDFGVVGYAVTVIAFLDIVSDLGIGPAVIYHPESHRMFSTAFWLGLLFSTLLFLLTFVAAPLVGYFFRDERAVNVTRVLAISFPIAALGAIHDTILRKKLSFRKTVLPDFLQSTSKGLFSIAFALLGLGAMSLILGQIIGIAIGVICLWIITPWRPSFILDRTIAKSLTGYGIKFVGVDFVGILLLNLDYLFVGRFLGASALGVYTFAFRLPDLLIMQFVRVISTVIFPIYSKMKDVGSQLSRGFSKTTRYVALLTVPVGLGLALVARPFVLTFFTDKWAEAIPVMRGIAMYAVFLSIAYNAGSVYKAEGRPQVLTWLGLFRLTLLAPALYWAVAVMGSIVAVGWVQAAVAFIGGSVSLVAAGRLLKISLRDLFASIRPSFLSGAIMSAAVLPVLYFGQDLPNWVLLTLAVLTGAVTYGAGVWLLEREMVFGFSQKVFSALSRRG